MPTLFVPAVQKVLQNGGDPNICNADGLTPLHKVGYSLIPILSRSHDLVTAFHFLAACFTSKLSRIAHTHTHIYMHTHTHTHTYMHTHTVLYRQHSGDGGGSTGAFC